MKIQQVTFKGDVKNGKKLFEKLSRKEQITAELTERSRQKYNEMHSPGISIPQEEGDLWDYIRRKIFVSKIVKDVLHNRKQETECYRKASNSIK